MSFLIIWDPKKDHPWMVTDCTWKLPNFTRELLNILNETYKESNEFIDTFLSIDW